TRSTGLGIAPAHYAEKAGAVAAIIIDVIVSDPPYSVSMIPSSATEFPVTIPVVVISQPDVQLLAAATGTITITLTGATDQRVGMDTMGHTDLFASNPVQGLSTLAPWDPLMRPDLL